MKRFVFCGSFRAARMTSSISHWRSNCARDCPIEWLLKVEASETEGELLMAWIVGSFLNLRGAEGGDLPDEQALSETSTVLSTKV